MFDGFIALWRNDRLFLRVIFLTAIALRLGWFAYSLGEPEFPDEADYWTTAKQFENITDFHGWARPDRILFTTTLTRPPLYPAIFALLPGKISHPLFFKAFLQHGSGGAAYELRAAPSSTGCELALFILQAILGGLTTVWVVRLGSFLGRLSWGKMAGIVYCFHPYAIFFSAQVLTDTVLQAAVVAQVFWLLCSVRSEDDLGNLWGRRGAFAFLMLLTYAFLWLIFIFTSWDLVGIGVLAGLLVQRIVRRDGGKGPWIESILAGFLGGTCALLHAGHIAFVFVGVLVLWRTISTGRSWWSHSGICAVYAAAFAFPVVTRQAAVYFSCGEIFPVTTKLGSDLYEAFGPEATGRTQKDKIVWPAEIRGLDEVKQDLVLRRLAWERIKADPLRAVWLGVKKVAYTWNPFPNWEGASAWYYRVASGLFCIPILLGALLSPFVVKGPKPVLWALWAPILYYTALHAVFVGSVRYRMAFEPCLIVLAAATWVTLAGRFRRPSTPDGLNPNF